MGGAPGLDCTTPEALALGATDGELKPGKLARANISKKPRIAVVRRMKEVPTRQSMDSMYVHRDCRMDGESMVFLVA